VARFRTGGGEKCPYFISICYNKGLAGWHAFDGPGSPAYLLRGPMSLLILHGALVCYTISRIINIISDSLRSEAKGKSGFQRVHRGVSCRFGNGAPLHILNIYIYIQMYFSWVFATIIIHINICSPRARETAGAPATSGPPAQARPKLLLPSRHPRSSPPSSAMPAYDSEAINPALEAALERTYSRGRWTHCRRQRPARHE
jgi:hypothetical protein